MLHQDKVHSLLGGALTLLVTQLLLVLGLEIFLLVLVLSLFEHLDGQSILFLYRGGLGLRASFLVAKPAAKFFSWRDCARFWFEPR